MDSRLGRSPLAHGQLHLPHLSDKTTNAPANRTDLSKLRPQELRCQLVAQPDQASHLESAYARSLHACESMARKNYRQGLALRMETNSLRTPAPALGSVTRHPDAP